MRDIGGLYLGCAQAHFARYMTRYTEDKFRAAGIHLVYALEAHVSTAVDDNLERIQDFCLIYIQCQLGNFNTWCRDLRNDFNRIQSDDGGGESPYGFKIPDASRPKLLQYPGCLL